MVQRLPSCCRSCGYLQQFQEQPFGEIQPLASRQPAGRRHAACYAYVVRNEPNPQRARPTCPKAGGGLNNHGLAWSVVTARSPLGELVQ